MKKYTNVVILLTILLLSSFATSAKDLPYKGRALGEVKEFAYIGDPYTPGVPFLWERAEATGNFTEVGDAKINLEWTISWKIEGNGGVFVLVGTFQIIAADGSEMSGDFCSLQSFTSLTNQIEVNVLTGSGRFNGVSGLIPGEGIRTGSNFCYALNGTISASRGK
jgi:hypothetical protein